MAELTEEKLVEILNARDDRFEKILDKRFQASEEKFIEILDFKLTQFPTREEFVSLKDTVNDIHEKVDRIDKRTDEDVRAVMKDVERIRVNAIQ